MKTTCRTRGPSGAWWKRTRWWTRRRWWSRWRRRAGTWKGCATPCGPAARASGPTRWPRTPATSSARTGTGSARNTADATLPDSPSRPPSIPVSICSSCLTVNVLAIFVCFEWKHCSRMYFCFNRLVTWFVIRELFYFPCWIYYSMIYNITKNDNRKSWKDGTFRSRTIRSCRVITVIDLLHLLQRALITSSESETNADSKRNEIMHAHISFQKTTDCESKCEVSLMPN